MTAVCAHGHAQSRLDLQKEEIQEFVGTIDITEASDLIQARAPGGRQNDPDKPQKPLMSNFANKPNQGKGKFSSNFSRKSIGIEKLGSLRTNSITIFKVVQE